MNMRKRVLILSAFAACMLALILSVISKAPQESGRQTSEEEDGVSEAGKSADFGVSAQPGDSSVLFRNAPTYDPAWRVFSGILGPDAYVWLVRPPAVARTPNGSFEHSAGGGRVFLQHNGWEDARTFGGLTIQQTLHRARPIIWRFFRELFERFPDMRQISISSLVRSAGTHAGGLALDLGEVVFSDSSSDFRYYRTRYDRITQNADKQYEGGQYVKRQGEAAALPQVYWDIRDWLWEREYIIQYIDPWYIRDKIYHNVWRRNQLRRDNSLEWTHHHHLHLTFRNI